jgi:Mor family transcriptional regulator
MGRPSSLTDRQKEKIIEKTGAGATPTQLSKEYGVSRATIYSVIQVRRDRD